MKFTGQLSAIVLLRHGFGLPDRYGGSGKMRHLPGAAVPHDIDSDAVLRLSYPGANGVPFTVV
ncbi:hypothetical protein Ct61P_03993 [Colletotrichum tofieldiae]|nr:hypothetical protein Ct61P_03993 [Colletotrichum tofieldiae]